MIRVCVAGSTGWTGSAIVPAVQAADDLELVGCVSRSRAGEDNVYATADEALHAATADVLVDFTHATAVKANVHAALERQVNVVVGSSGLSGEEYAEIDELARKRGVGVIAAGNFSLLAALLLRSAVEIARHVESWEIIDYAKAEKPDVPSGTARELAERLAAARRPRVARAVDSLVGPAAARGASVEGTQVHSVRLPSFVVSTEAVFAATGERLVLRHDAGETPAPYVAGTLLAIRSIVGRVGLTRGLDQLLS
jgi:4-hydroxy-tetrahydrodipicolinate reductase